MLDPVDRDTLTAWELGEIFDARTPTTGAINRTLLIESAVGNYVLRAYRHRDRSKVETEHALIGYAADQGLPTPRPIPLPDGGTIWAQEGRFFALFPRAAGVQIHRSELDQDLIAAMGSFLARVHIALEDYPRERVAARTIEIDRGRTLTDIDRLLDILAGRPVLDDVDRWAIERLTSRREWLDLAAPPALPDLSRYQQQVIHGDYQETNLFFAGSRVSAIIDWDQSYTAPRAWEVIRTLDLVWDFAAEPCRIFLDAYRAMLPLDPDELDSAAIAYGLMRAHDLWVFDAYYREGNHRVAAFIRPGRFVPLTEHWAAVREAFQ